MSTSQSSALTKAPMRLWRRFNIWCAMRIYASVDRQARRDVLRLRKADALMRRHAEDPQRRLPLGDD